MPSLPKAEKSSFPAFPETDKNNREMPADFVQIIFRNNLTKGRSYDTIICTRLLTEARWRSTGEPGIYESMKADRLGALTYDG